MYGNKLMSAGRLHGRVLKSSLNKSVTYGNKNSSQRLISNNYYLPAVRFTSYDCPAGSVLTRCPKWKTKNIRGVATWSSLASAFNNRPERRLFPAFSNSDKKGLFLIPELTDETGFYLLDQKARARTDQLISEATSSTRTRAVVRIFDDLSDTLCRVADMSDFVRVAHPDTKYISAADDACSSISTLVEMLNVNVDIYAALRNSIKKGDIKELDEVDKRVAELFLFDFEQSGIHLDEKARQKFVELNENILTMGYFFSKGSHSDIAVPKKYLPVHLRDVFSAMPGGNTVTVTGMFSENTDSRVREAAYRVYLYPDNQQLQRLDALLTARHQMAQLTGFSSYAERALRGTMGQNPERVMSFLKLLAEKVRPTADKEVDFLTRLKHSSGDVTAPLQPWDTTFYGALARQQACDIDNSSLAPYFSLGACMEGLSGLFSSLYGVTLRCERASTGELWSDDVVKLSVIDESLTGDSAILGTIYCDFFERTGKPHQDCHFTIRGGRQLDDGSYQSPVVVLMLNLPRGRGGGFGGGVGGCPSLLTHGMVENLFHEFGHAMHSMLGRTRYQHVTGTRCSTDFAEVPSVLMEFFANDERVLSSFARHWKTGEKLSQDVIKRLCQAKRMFAASDTQLQVFYSILDQQYHNSNPPVGSTTEALRDIQNKYHCLPYVDGTAWQLRFAHFVGYGAKYYSYLMSRAVASKIWQRCFRENPFSSEMGRKYRTTMLAYGGELPPSQLVENLLGETPTNDMLVGALVDDLNLSVEALHTINDSKNKS